MFILEVRQLFPEASDSSVFRRVKVSQQYYTESDEPKALEIYKELRTHLPNGYEVDLVHIYDGHKVPIAEFS